ncbi:hemolysin activation/secretion protein, partial [Pectinatus brassicae]
MPKEQRSFLIRDFVIEHNGTRRFNWMNGELKQYKGQYIGAKGISMLSKMLSDKMIARGFVTSQIIVPKQNLKDG